jgi:type I restriction enzyme, S subunit
MPYQKYTTCKSSGIDWLGDIPNDWDIKRLKELGTLQNGVSNDADYFGSGYPFVSYGNVYNDNIEIESISTFAKSSKEDQLMYSVKENDVFFTRTSETVEEVGFASTCMKTIPNAVFSGFVIRFRPRSHDMSKGFSKYFFKAKSHRFFFVKEMNIVTRASLSQGVLSNLPVLIPRPEVQLSITEYLDKKICLIDKKINILKNKKIRYQELRQVIIGEVITKGLNKNIKMKDSNIRWIGDVPSHWEIKRGKDVFKYIKKINKNLECKNVLSLTYGGVINKDYDTKSGLNPESYETYQFVNKNDLIFKLIDLENIKTSRVGIVHEDGIMSSAYIRIKSNNRTFNKFFYYLYFYYYKINLFNYLGGGVRSTLNFSSLLEISILVPSLIEQISISEYLDEKTNKIDKIIESIDKNINSLYEFRETVINNVVTGKIRII